MALQDVVEAVGELCEHFGSQAAKERPGGGTVPMPSYKELAVLAKAVQQIGEVVLKKLLGPPTVTHHRPSIFDPPIACLAVEDIAKDELSVVDCTAGTVRRSGPPGAEKSAAQPESRVESDGPAVPPAISPDARRAEFYCRGRNKMAWLLIGDEVYLWQYHGQYQSPSGTGWVKAVDSTPGRARKIRETSTRCDTEEQAVLADPPAKARRAPDPDRRYYLRAIGEGRHTGFAITLVQAPLPGEETQTAITVNGPVETGLHGPIPLLVRLNNDEARNLLNDMVIAGLGPEERPSDYRPTGPALEETQAAADRFVGLGESPEVTQPESRVKRSSPAERWEAKAGHLQDCLETNRAEYSKAVAEVTELKTKLKLTKANEKDLQAQVKNVKDAATEYAKVMREARQALDAQRAKEAERVAVIECGIKDLVAGYWNKINFVIGVAAEYARKGRLARLAAGFPYRQMVERIGWPDRVEAQGPLQAADAAVAVIVPPRAADEPESVVLPGSQPAVHPV